LEKIRKRWYPGTEIPRRYREDTLYNTAGYNKTEISGVHILCTTFEYNGCEESETIDGCNIELKETFTEDSLVF
jgi:hypothetical protein